MRTRGVIYVCIGLILFLVSACAVTTTESGAEREKPQKCYEHSDCPSGFRCNVKNYTCERSF